MTTVQIQPAQVRQHVTFDPPEGGEGFSMVYNPRAEEGYVATLELTPGVWTVTQSYTIEVPEPEEESTDAQQ